MDRDAHALECVPRTSGPAAQPLIPGLGFFVSNFPDRSARPLPPDLSAPPHVTPIHRHNSTHFGLLPAQAPCAPSNLPAKTATTPEASAHSPAEWGVSPAKLAVVPADLAAFPAKLAIISAKSGTYPAKSALLPAKLAGSPANPATFPAKSAESPATSSTLPAKSGVFPADSGRLPAKPKPAPAELFHRKLGFSGLRQPFSMNQTGGASGPASPGARPLSRAGRPTGLSAAGAARPPSAAIFRHQPPLPRRSTATPRPSLSAHPAEPKKHNKNNCIESNDHE